MNNARQNKKKVKPALAVNQRKGNLGRRPRSRKSNASLSPQKQQSVAVAYSTGQSTRAPIINASRSQSRIVHRELVASIFGSSNYQNAFAFALNPGIATSFPWLATQAVGWERYHFNALRYCYYTRTSSVTPGSLLLTPDYDAADAAPLSEQIASAYEDCVEDSPWKDIECYLSADGMHPDGPKSTKFVRTTALSSNLDIKTYDVGNLFVGTTDGSNVGWGKLWVEYDITFHTPQLPPTGSFDIIFESNSGNVPTSTNMLGGTPSVAPGSSNVFQVVGEVVTFLQGGDFLVLYHAFATTVTQTAAVTASSGASFLPYLGSATPTQAGSGTAQMTQVMIVNTTAGGVLTFNNTIVSGIFSELSALTVSSQFG